MILGIKKFDLYGFPARFSFFGFLLLVFFLYEKNYKKKYGRVPFKVMNSFFYYY